MWKASGDRFGGQGGSRLTKVNGRTEVDGGLSKWMALLRR